MKYKLKETSFGLDMLDTVLKTRGLTLERAKAILSPSLIVEEDVLNYINIDKGIKLLKETINNNEKIVILCDVDCDGLCSTSIIYRFIKYDLGYNNIEIITQRYNNKAHGLTEDAMEQIYNLKAKLVITPDSSSNDYDKHKELCNNNIKCLVLDHHIWDKKEDLEGIVIINNQDGKVENTALSGTGVTYKFVKHYANLHNINLKEKYLDLVSVSLISDVCDMSDLVSLENRLYFNMGTKIENISNSMLKALISKGKLGNEEGITIKDIAFGISPIINAVIRIAPHEDRVDLIKAFTIDTDISFYELVIKKSESYKRKQKKMTDTTVEKLEDRIIEKNLLDNKVLIINGTNIVDKSITGLVATKLSSKYNRPTLLFTVSNDYVCAGSARTYGNIDFKDLCEKSNLLITAIGHSGAYGFSVHANNLVKLNNYLNEALSEVKLVNIREVDSIIDIKDLTLSDVISIGELSELWCNTIPEPLFVIKNIRLHSSDIQKFGIANYSFTKNNHLHFNRNFCKKSIYEAAIFKNEKPFGCNIIMDAIVKFTKNQRGFIVCEIVDWETKIDDEIIF